MTEHEDIKNFWLDLGEILGYEVGEEYQISGSQNRIDVVWKKKNKLIGIEIENSSGISDQMRKNMTKAIDINPDLIIMDVKLDVIANKINNHGGVLPKFVKAISRNNLNFINYDVTKDVSDPVVREIIEIEEKKRIDSFEKVKLFRAKAFVDGEKETAISDIYIRLEGILDKEQIDRLIMKFKMCGDVYEPRRGFLVKV